MKKTGFLVIASMLASAPVLAEPMKDSDAPDVFVGGALSYGKLSDLKVGGNDVEDLGDLDNFEDDRNSWKVFAGVWFTPWLGLEGQYLDLGKYKDNGVSIDPEAKTASVLLGLPLAEHSRVYVKGGRMWWEAETNGPLGFSDKREGDTMFYGAGVSTALLPVLNLRLEYERAAFDDDNIEADLDFASVGAEFIF